MYFLPDSLLFQRGNTDQVIGIGRMERNLYIIEIMAENHFCHFFREKKYEPREVASVSGTSLYLYSIAHEASQRTISSRNC